MKLRDATEKLSIAQREEKPSKTLMEAQEAQRIGNPKKERQRH